MNTLKFEHPPEDSTKGPTHQRIQARAYELYLARGGVPGHEQEDWFRAERELTDAWTSDAFTNEGAPVTKAPRPHTESGRSNRSQGDRSNSSANRH